MDNKLSETEIKVIRDFLDRVEKMESSAFLEYLNKQKKVFTNFNCNVERGFEFKTNTPNTDQIASYLLYFRQVYAQKERTNLNKICNIIEKNSLITGKSLKNIREFRDIFNKTLKQEVRFKMVLNKETIANTVEELFDLFINGEFFHSDEKYIELIKQAKMTPMYPLLWQLFMTSLVDISNPIFGIRNNIHIFFNKR
ncbi:MAG: hypothetical protein WCY37_03920 [Candidatus Dojkabacteria bacterium]